MRMHSDTFTCLYVGCYYRLFFMLGNGSGVIKYNAKLCCYVRKQQPALAKRVAKLKDNIDQPLAAILTLNTIAHTAGAAGVGAQAAVVFSDAAVGIASAIMTLLVLVLSEIIPKTLGANYWRGLTPIVSISLIWLVVILKPFVWFADILTRFLGRNYDEAYYIRQEIEAMADIGTESGALGHDESEIIRVCCVFATLS